MEKQKKERKPLWLTLMDDTNMLLAREVEPRRFHFIEATDMVDACGRDALGEPWVVELSEADLDAIGEKAVERACESCGWEQEEAFTDLQRAEMCHSYGARAPLDSWSGGRVRKETWEDSPCPRELIRSAKRRSRELDDPAEREAALMRPVNKIGSTALEYMQGDLHSAITRGAAAGSAEAKLMAKLHGASEESIAAVEQAGLRSGAVAVQVQLATIPSDDPIAYMMGFLSGVRGTPLDAERDELAPEYIKGYQHGVRVRLGEEDRPSWAA